MLELEVLCVFGKGSSEDETKLIKNFLGRAPNQKAFLKEVIGQGVKVTKNS